MPLFLYIIIKKKPQGGKNRIEERNRNEREKCELERNVVLYWSRG